MNLEQYKDEMHQIQAPERLRQRVLTLAAETPDRPQWDAAPKKAIRFPLKKVLPAAACLALAAGMFIYTQHISPIETNLHNKANIPDQQNTIGGIPDGGTSFPSGDMTDGAGGNPGSGDSALYCCYAPPVLPLTAQDRDLAAGRNLHFDLTPLLNDEESPVFTDEYTLHADGTERTARLMYPYTTEMYTISNFPEQMPVVTVDGVPVKTTLIPGPALNCGNWEDYCSLLADGNYQRMAESGQLGALSSAEVDKILSQTVTLYSMVGYTGKQNTLNYPVARVSAEDSPRVYSINAASWFFQADSSILYTTGFSFEAQKNLSSAIPPTLLVFGEPLSAPDFAVYNRRPPNKHQPVPDTEVTVETHTASLGDVVEYVVDDALNHQDYFRNYTPQDREMILNMSRQAAAALAANGSPQSSPHLFDVSVLQQPSRVWYFAFDVSVPADRDVTVQITSRPSLSTFQMVDEEAPDRNEIYGCEAAASLGSTIHFDRITAELVCPPEITVESNTFGFDPEKGVFTAQPDPAEECFKMRLRVKHE